MSVSMAKRPPKRTASGETQQVRIRKELAEKLMWILWMRAGPGGTPESTALFLDPIIRPIIDAEYALIEATVERIKAERKNA